MRLASFLRRSATVMALSASLAGTATGQVLFDNGPATSGGLSEVRTGSTLYGLNANKAFGNTVADDFAVTGAWKVTGFSFFAYHRTYSNNYFAFTGLSWSIVAGNVNTGPVMASGSLVLDANTNNGGLVGYRVTSTTLDNTDRPIYQIDADVPEFVLGSGSYWLRWGLSGESGLYTGQTTNR